ncbi:hypothetical protein DFQ26_009516 [Actinomortierella ambigua]|nr:hypothetical protein DFQ26_009516 [Actinomortierella ambigua]
MSQSVGCIDSLRAFFTRSSATSRDGRPAGHSRDPTVRFSKFQRFSTLTGRTLTGSPSSFAASNVSAPLAVIDMGSNGIRFAILASLDRHLPVLYEERASISLYDAQWGGGAGGKGGKAIDEDDDESFDGVTSKLDIMPGPLTPSISNSATIAVLGQGSTTDLTDQQEDDRTDDFDDDDDRARLTSARTAVMATAAGASTSGAAAGTKPVGNPISEKVIQQVIKTFQRWNALCRQVNVQRVRLIATEATRTASNSQEFRDRIKEATGWDVEMLPKEDEARVGALGVMASYYTVQGLFMDLGGGSVQLNYIIRKPTDGPGQSSKDAKSWPYGAAALSRRLNSCANDGERDQIFKEMVAAFTQGLEDINVHPDITRDRKKHHGYKVYLSGGGFRALGYLIMARQQPESKHHKDKNGGQRYPIPIINGLTATGEELAQIVKEYRHMKPEDVPTAFRVSKRRAKQVPACATLMAAVMETFPIREVCFSEGGVRQGGCFGELPTEIQNRDPTLRAAYDFVEMTGQEVPEDDVEALSSFVSMSLPNTFPDGIMESLSNGHDKSSAPGGSSGAGAGVGASSASHQHHDDDHSPVLSDKELYDRQKFLDAVPRLIPILVLTMNCYVNMPKEARSTAAFHLFLPGGAMANCPGLTHSDRAILATVLAERHDGDLADPELGDQIKKLVPGGKWERQTCKYLGKILALAGLCAPLPGVAAMVMGGGATTQPGGRIIFDHRPVVDQDAKEDEEEGEEGQQQEGGGDGRRRRRRRRHGHRRGASGKSAHKGSGSSGSESDSGSDSDGGRVVILQGVREIGQHHVEVRLERGHPILEAPVIKEAIDDLAKAAKKTQSFGYDLLSGGGHHGKGKKSTDIQWIA